MFNTQLSCCGIVTSSRLAVAAVLLLCVAWAGRFAPGADRADSHLERLDRTETAAEFGLRAERAARIVLDRLGVTLSTAESAMFADAEDGVWDTHSLLEAALVAGGAGDRNRLHRYRERYRAVAAAIRQSLPEQAGQEEKAQRILEMLHRRVLTGGYELGATELPSALDDGRFNCVSATVLFVCLAKDLGLDARAVESTGHVAAEVLLHGKPVRVETTCSRWFRLSAEQRKRQSAAIAGRQRQMPGYRPVEPLPHSGRRAGDRAVSAGHKPLAAQPDSPPRAITPVQLVAAIYYNRGVDLLLAEQFEAAASCNAKALLLDRQNRLAWGNLLATLNNWAVHLAKAGKHTEAVELLEGGLVLAPEYRPFRWNLQRALRHSEQAAAVRSASPVGYRPPRGESAP